MQTQAVVGARPDAAHETTPTFTLQGVGIWITLLLGVLGIYKMLRDWRKEQDTIAENRTAELKAEINKHNDNVEGRLKTLEVQTKDFMPRAEIEQKIEHEKNNRLTANEAILMRLARHDESISEIKVSVARIDERQATISSTVDEVKVLVKDQGREFAAKLDKIQEIVTKRG